MMAKCGGVAARAGVAVSEWAPVFVGWRRHGRNIRYASVATVEQDISPEAKKQKVEMSLAAAGGESSFLRKS